MSHYRGSDRKKLFYGWVIVAAGVIIMSVAVGVMSNCMPLYIVPICNELQISRSAGGLISTLIAMGGVVISAVSPALYSRVSLRISMRLGSIVMCIGYFFMSQSGSIWMLYATAMATSLSMWLMGYVPFAILLGNWFERKTGFVIGVTYMGTGLGGMIFNPIIASLIADHGWRTAMMVVAGIMAVCVIPASFLIFDRPSDKGLLPYGHDDSPAACADMPKLEGTPFKEALRSKAYIIILAGMCFSNMAACGFHQTLSAFLTDRGNSLQLIAMLASAGMASLALGKIVLGWFYDNWGTKLTTAISGLIQVSGLVASLFLPKILPFALVILAYGLGFSSPSVGMPVILRSEFGMRDFVKLNGLAMTVSSLLSSLGATFSGAVCDFTGSYSYSYLFYAAAVFITTVLMVIVLKPGRNNRAA